MTAGDPGPAPGDHAPGDHARASPPRGAFAVEADEAGSRLETFLRRRLGWARALAQRALRRGWVRLDGKRAGPDARLEPGQTVRVTNYALLDGLPGAGPDASGPAPGAVGEHEAARPRAGERGSAVAPEAGLRPGAWPDGRGDEADPDAGDGDERPVAGERAGAGGGASAPGGGASQAPPAPVPAADVARARASLRHVTPGWVVAAKPAGVVVHPGSGHAWGWADAVARALGDATTTVSIGRLDRDTSGLLVLARTRGAARAGFAALAAGTLARTYAALVLGAPDPPAGAVALALGKEGPRGREQVRPQADGRAARTRYRTRARHGPASLLELELDTGRTHQIRAHLAALGHPVLGDPRHGDAPARALARRLGVPRLFLHAGRLVVPPLGPDDPAGPLTFDEPLPPELAAALR